MNIQPRIYKHLGKVKQKCAKHNPQKTYKGRNNINRTMLINLHKTFISQIYVLFSEGHKKEIEFIRKKHLAVMGIRTLIVEI